MRKWLGVASLTVAFCGIGGYFYFAKSTPPPITDLVHNVHVPTKIKGDDGDAEPSEKPVEPIHVETGITRRMEAAKDDGPMPRVMLEPGMKQPPRPDAEPGRAPRMPYADEEEILDLARPPLQQILDPTLKRLNIFEQIENANPAKESESKPPRD